MLALIWTTILVGYVLSHGMNSQNPGDRIFGYFALYGIFAMIYLELSTLAQFSQSQRDIGSE